MFKNIKGFESKSQLFTWLYRIATNEAITYLNKKRKKSTATDEETLKLLENNLKADNYFDGNEAQLQLIKAIEVLPEKTETHIQHEVF